MFDANNIVTSLEGVTILEVCPNHYFPFHRTDENNTLRPPYAIVVTWLKIVTNTPSSLHK